MRFLVLFVAATACGRVASSNTDPDGSACTNGTIACGARCVDVTSDPEHCGGCDVTCGRSSPDCVNAKCVVARSRLATGDFHTCAITNAGLVKCWGGNFEGQVGDGTTSHRTTPTLVALPGGDEVDAVTAGSQHSCARRKSGVIACWGRNWMGEIGNGTTERQTLAVPLALSGVAQVSGGGQHTCARLLDGSVSCWGFNLDGQIGDGSTTNRTHPTSVIGISTSIDIVAEGNHSCSVAADGTVSCWGWNSEGQIGAGTTTNVPMNVATMTDVIAVTAGTYHTCILRADATIWCWGSGMWGQLGNGAFTRYSLPLQVPLSDVKAIEAGGVQTCALVVGGDVYCWGAFVREVDGTAGTRTSPVKVAEGAVAISAGGAHTCLLRASGSIECWGSNDLGQVGDGTKTNRLVPTPVNGF